MKGFAVIVFAGCIAVALCGSEEYKAKMMEIADACQAETGADSADVLKKMKDGDFSSGGKMGEFLFCFFKKVGFLNDAGEYQIDMIKTILTQKYSGDVATQIIEVCSKETKATGPETALYMAKCHFENKPKN